MWLAKYGTLRFVAAAAAKVWAFRSFYGRFEANINRVGAASFPA
jgi:hypothetical protein